MSSIPFPETYGYVLTEVVSYFYKKVTVLEHTFLGLCRPLQMRNEGCLVYNKTGLAQI